METKRVEFLGVKVDKLSLVQARRRVEEFLFGAGQVKIFTPNPEMVVLAQRDLLFREVINSGDLNLCDGFGLAFFGRFTRIPGVDFMLDICARAEILGKSIYLLGSGSQEVAGSVMIKLKEKFPALNVVGFHEGPAISEESEGRDPHTIFSGLQVNTKENEMVLKEIKEKRPDILFVAFGMGKQEKWIHEFLPECSSVKIAMGVGGAFDYLSGRVSRAPCFMRKIGLEWLYRLFREPKRVRRIFNATAVFIYWYGKTTFFGRKKQS